MVFVDSVKELPATLLLRPFNFDTLATRVHDQASLENLKDASPAAILVIAVGLSMIGPFARTVRADVMQVRVQLFIEAAQRMSIPYLRVVWRHVLPNVMHLPTMAATAHYHGKAGIGVPLAEFVQEARDYAQTDYLQALMKGNTISDEEFGQVATRLMLMTGLSETYIQHAKLRLRPSQFHKELLRFFFICVSSFKEFFQITSRFLEITFKYLIFRLMKNQALKILLIFSK